LSFQFLRLTVAAVFVIAVVSVAAVFVLVPGQRNAAAARPAIGAAESDATLAALKPPKRARPVVAVLAANDGTETTDFLIPHGLIKRSGVADVFAVAMMPGPVILMPALTINPEMTVAAFDQRYPDGADYVIVPAMHNSDSPAVLAWITAQAKRGAIIVGICEGARVLANAGLLDGRSATTHWFALADVQAAHPTMRYARDRRFVADRGVVTTTGVSASLPISLAIVAAIGGREGADALAREVGVAGWDATHDSGQFHLTRDDVWAVIGNVLSFWRHEIVGIPVSTGVDEIALAFTADAYSRTYTSRAVALASAGGAVITAQGIVLVPDGLLGRQDIDVELPALPQDRPARALESALSGIAARYGQGTADMVRLQLEDGGTN
jgi:putative intracellular protease/amidase